MDSILNKRATPLLIVAALLFLAVAGCATSGKRASVKTINKQEFEALQKASKKLTTLTEDLRSMIQTQVPVNERNARVEEVFTKYSRDFPQIQNLNAPGMLPENEKKALRGTISGELLALYLQGEKGKTGDEAARRTPAAPIALQYLGALNALYGLREFESYMAQHTIGDGTKPNSQDPPVSMGGAQAFGWSGIGLNPMGEDCVGVTVGFDPGNGIVRYWMSDFSSGSSASAPEVTPYTVERAILQHGKDLASEADSGLVEHVDF